MDTCKAAVFVGANRPIEVQEFPVLPTEPGGALVQMQMAAICGTDVHAWHLDATPAPTIFGHENIGVLAELSPELTTDVLGQPLQVGDRVIFRDAPCGRCFRCAMGESCQHSRSYGMIRSDEPPHLRGGFGQYLQLSATPWLLRVPDDVSNERALLSVIGNHTALNGIERIGGINSADTVLVQGSGPIGMGALNQSLIGGAGRVIVVGAPESRLALARRLGATDTVDLADCPTPEARVERVMELTNGRGADVVIEASGGLTAFQEGLEMVRFGGRYLVIGQWTDYGLLSAKPLAAHEEGHPCAGRLFSRAASHHPIAAIHAHHRQQAGRGVDHAPLRISGRERRLRGARTARSDGRSHPPQRRARQVGIPERSRHG